MTNSSGFTLSELLIALAILGLIATFTIPKVIQSVDASHQRALIKDTYSALNQILYEGHLDGTIRNQADFKAAAIQKLNAVQVCNTNVVTENCASASMWDPNGDDLGQAGFVLPNGAVIYGIDNSGFRADVIIVDVNGPAPPNERHEDSWGFVTCYESIFQCGDWPSDGYTGRTGPGTLAPTHVSPSVFEELFGTP